MEFKWTRYYISCIWGICNLSNCGFDKYFILNLVDGEDKHSMLKNDIHIKMPPEFADAFSLGIIAKTTKSAVISKFAIGKKPLTEYEYVMLTHNISKFVLINGKYVYADSSILNVKTGKTSIKKYKTKLRINYFVL